MTICILIVYSKAEYFSEYFDFTLIFTDTSITDQRVEAAIICKYIEIQLKLSSYSIIYTAEILAVLEAIKFTVKSMQDNRVTTLSDSLSSLTNIQNTKYLIHTIIYATIL